VGVENSTPPVSPVAYLGFGSGGRGSRADNGDLGAKPPSESRSPCLVRESGRSPMKLKHF